MHVLLDAAERLQAVCIEQSSWQECLRRYDAPGTLFYLAPPYFAGACGRSWERYVHDMPTAADHEELLAAVLSLQGIVILSGYHSALYGSALAGWSVVEIAARDAHNNARTEVLWLSPRCAMAQRRLWP